MRSSVRIISSLLAIMSIMLFCACSNTTDADEVTTNGGGTEDTNSAGTENVDANGYLKDNLPADLNFGGEDFTTLYWSDREHEEFFTDGQNGEIVNDALFTRNRQVEERLGVTLKFVGTPGNGQNIQNFTNTLSISIQSNDHAYDLVGGYSISTASCAYHGLLANLYESEYLDFSMPWWPDNLIDQATICGKLYFASGAISANVLYMMYVTYFNKQYLSDFNLESPFDLVKNDEWTIDKMFSMCQNLYSDLNANGKKDEGDRFGFYAQKLHTDAIFWGTGIKTVDNTGDTLKVSESFYSEMIQDLLQKVNSFLYYGNDGIMITSDSTYVYFGEGKSLFWMDRARQAITGLQNYEDLKFGIVPIPKCTENQENYACVMGNPFTLYAIPVDNQAINRSAAVMECMASESYRNVTPALFETAMKYKYSPDEISSQMFDIVRSSVVFDLGRIFYSVLNGIPAATWEKAVYENAASWTVLAKAQSKVFVFCK
ncbi:MAG: hypothetical protein GX057_01160 [Clostridiales bacterium]|nr:hypothetical protein [Clostridiales bacterium]